MPLGVVIYADQRWIGNHGIGRFARNVLDGLLYQPVQLSGHPAATFDAWQLSRALAGLTSDDLFFSPGYNSPLFCRAPFVFTIHDLSHVYCPENSSAVIRAYYATVMRRACKRAAMILTVSEFTRGQIVEWSGVPEEKVLNVCCGVDPAYRPEGETYGMQFPYLLCAGNRKKHKNEFRVVEAFAKTALDSRIHLVFLGNPSDALMNCIRRLRVETRIDFAGVVPEQRLPGLYRGAEALVFPSLFEGFGLPLLEAMACGVPVVTSNVTAMPEVAGDAAVLVDPTSVENISQAMERIVNDRLLRAELREKGLARAAQFSWSSTHCKVHRALRTI